MKLRVLVLFVLILVFTAGISFAADTLSLKNLKQYVHVTVSNKGEKIAEYVKVPEGKTYNIISESKVTIEDGEEVDVKVAVKGAKLSGVVVSWDGIQYNYYKSANLKLIKPKTPNRKSTLIIRVHTAFGIFGRQITVHSTQNKSSSLLMDDDSVMSLDEWLASQEIENTFHAETLQGYGMQAYSSYANQIMVRGNWYNLMQNSLSELSPEDIGKIVVFQIIINEEFEGLKLVSIFDPEVQERQESQETEPVTIEDDGKFVRPGVTLSLNGNKFGESTEQGETISGTVKKNSNIQLDLINRNTKVKVIEVTVGSLVKKVDASSFPISLIVENENPNDTLFKVVFKYFDENGNVFKNDNGIDISDLIVELSMQK